MGLPDATGSTIAMGFNCHVRIGENAEDAQSIALAASFQANEDFQVQDAIVLGHLGPVAIDPQGYTCTITVDGFLPSRRALQGNPAISQFMPSRASFMQKGGISDAKISYLDFWNKHEGILAAFRGVIPTNFGISADGNAYVRNNVQFRALERTTNMRKPV